MTITALSLRAGHREAHHAAGRTICDALMAAMPGELTFSINSKLLAKGVTASDEEVGAAVAFAYRELKLVVEPGGAVGLAALLAGRIDAKRQERRHRSLRRQCRRGLVRQAGRLKTKSGRAMRALPAIVRRSAIQSASECQPPRHRRRTIRLHAARECRRRTSPDARPSDRRRWTRSGRRDLPKRSRLDCAAVESWTGCEGR